MKKLIVVLTVLLVAVSVLFAGCSSDTKPDTKALDKKAGTTKVTSGTKYLSIGTGSVTGVYYPLGGTLASIVTNKVPGYSCAAESTGGAVENAALLIDGKLDLGFVAASTLYDAQHGLNSFKGKDGTKVQALFSFFPEVVQILSLDKSIKKIPDLKGKKVAVGAAGSGTEVMARAILQIYGMSYDDIKEDFLGFGDAATGLKDNTVDAAFTWAGIPTASILELCATHNISMISFSDDELKKLMKVSAYCVPAKITKKSYPKMYEDAQSFSIPAIICANANLDDKFVYDFMVQVFSNTEILAKTHERGADLSLKTALDGLNGVTLHPGAKKFFKEKGLLK